MGQIKWEYKSFEALSNLELYDILRLRSEVFVVEQNCVYADIDGKDVMSFHLFAKEGDKIVAYTRIIPPGISYAQASIGRVVTDQTVRRSGIGKELMARSIKESTATFPDSDIKIGAQLYLKSFYESFGFTQESDIYVEDGIPHIHMIRSK